MGNFCTKETNHICVVCHSEDCNFRRDLCGQCEFIHKFIIENGRKCLNDITVRYEQHNRPRALSLPTPPSTVRNRPRVTEVRSVWSEEPHISPTTMQMVARVPSAPQQPMHGFGPAPPDYHPDKYGR